MPRAIINQETFEDSKLDKRVENPSHYSWIKELCGVEPIDIARHMDFCLGNALKYIVRAGRKHEEGMDNILKEIEDLKKAVWYINDRIAWLTTVRNKRQGKGEQNE